MQSKPINGISIREFARREGCDDSVVRRKIRSGHLATLPDGKINPALVGTPWRPANNAAAPDAGAAHILTPEEAAAKSIADSGAPYSKAEAERIGRNPASL